MIEVKTLKAPDAELFALCIRAARLSHRSTGDAQRDHALAVRLAKAGDEHAKALRGLIVYAEINAPHEVKKKSTKKIKNSLTDKRRWHILILSGREKSLKGAKDERLQRKKRRFIHSGKLQR